VRVRRGFGEGSARVRRGFGEGSAYDLLSIHQKKHELV
jgi:hypothetical protein